MAAFTVIDHEELTGDTASWSKTSIPSSYDHLLIVASIRVHRSPGLRQVDFQWATPVWTRAPTIRRRRLQANSATPTSGRTTGQDSTFDTSDISADSTTADTFGTVKIWLPHYSNTANYTQAITQWSTKMLPTNGEWGG
jgi:hypothetical protein